MTEDKKTSIFTPQRTVKYFMLSFVVLAIACMAIWPLMDWLFSVIFNDTYSWTFVGGVITPCAFALIFTVLEFVFWNFFHKKK